jgi:hypothetical protein
MLKGAALGGATEGAGGEHKPRPLHGNKLSAAVILRFGASNVEDLSFSHFAGLNHFARADT